MPLCFWMPATYPTLTAPVAALFAGIMTKLGVFGLLRIAHLLTLDAVLPQQLLRIGHPRTCHRILDSVKNCHLSSCGLRKRHG